VVVVVGFHYFFDGIVALFLFFYFGAIFSAAFAV
jgi:hypothetical protein